MDVHSWTRPDLIRERHLDLLRRLDFDGAVLDSRAGFAGRAGVRVTFTAAVHTPDGLAAAMGAERRNGKFHTDDPVPSYLIALAAGDLAFRPLGQRSGVQAEPGLPQAGGEKHWRGLISPDRAGGHLCTADVKIHC
jgi:hypothetical protein